MLQLLKRSLWAGLLVLGLSSSWAYSLLGPLTGNGSEPWQVLTIGYNLPYLEISDFGSPVFLGDIGGPKNWGEGYRRNVPVIYYTADSLFYNYFNDSGINAIQQAAGIMNSVTNVDKYSTLLSELPMSTQEINYQAQALGLTDLKSQTLHLLVEQLGLAQPERFAWTLHDRNTFANCSIPCPACLHYTVVMRNFDPVASALNQIQYTPYVNGILYTYLINEYCTPQPLWATALTYNYPVDSNPSANTFTAVAANITDGLVLGGYYTGLTRDDVAGLRYLLSTNRINTEATAAGALLNSYDFNSNQLLSTTNYFALALAAQTTPPAALQALFPGLVINSVSNYFKLVVTPTITSYVTNLPGSPYGSLENVVVVSQTTNIVQFFAYTFGNVVANIYTNNTHAILQTITVAPANGSPFGSPNITTVSTQNITVTNIPSGDYYFLPAGACPYNFVQSLQTNVTAVTNTLIAATNGSLSLTENLITYFTNHIYVVSPCTLVTAPPGEYQGVGRVQFRYAPYDSYLSQYFQPITNTYTMVVLTNNHFVTQTFQRVVTTPDILFSAGDLAVGPAGNGFNGSVTRTTPNYVEDPTRVGSTVAFGPGVINGPSVFTFNKVGPTFFNSSIPNSTALVPNETSGIQGLIWASFDGSTNAPTVYPNGSYTNLLNSILIQVSPASLPNGTNNAAYGPVNFTAVGGAFVPPFTWSASGASSLNLNMTTDGILTASPTETNTFNIIVQLTDVNSRSMQWAYPLTIQ
jgi:hypothetical protein